ncbi:MAG: response regulator transcription factor [Umezawaea sp.]
MIRVLLADDEGLVRAGVRAVLGTDAGIEVVAEAADGREAVDLTIAHRPDVVLLDVQMPVLDGLDAADEIHRLVPSTGVVILTTFSEDAYIARALGGGASGFLLKAGDPRDLLAGVHAVADGAAYLSPRVARRVIAELDGGRLTRATTARTRVATLTPRERDVLTLVGAGLSNAEIAHRLHLVEGTVKAYMTSLMDRLAVRNRVQAAVLAHEAGLVVD